jgi:drug/metabolite transporter (DMT)-like permease
MWFAFALISAVFTGLQSFMGKVASEKGCDSYHISTVAAFSAFFSGSVVALVSHASLPHLPALVFWLGVASAILYTGRTITQLESLRFIDAAIYFPLYKVIGPVLVTAIGIIFLKNVIAFPALIGIVLSCMVPLLLITRHEHHRQRNLPLGLILLLASTAFAAVLAAINAYAVELSASYTIPFLIIAYGFGAAVSSGLYAYRHRPTGVYATFKNHSTRQALWIGTATGIFQIISFYFLLLAFAGGGLSVPYSINAHYIVIPVILSVWLYGEHWNKQKAFALVVSVLALILLHN